MTAHQLIQKLFELPEEQKSWPIYVEDGTDPSDPSIATQVVVSPEGEHFSFKYLNGECKKLPCIQIK